MGLTLQILPNRFAVCRLPADAVLPAWATEGVFFSVTRTADELSIIVQESSVPEVIQAQRGFVGFKVLGPLLFDAVGVLASLASPLAEAFIPILAIGTYDTDYLFVNHTQLDAAISVLNQGGHSVQGTNGDER